MISGTCKKLNEVKLLKRILNAKLTGARGRPRRRYIVKVRDDAIGGE